MYSSTTIWLRTGNALFVSMLQVYSGGEISTYAKTIGYQGVNILLNELVNNASSILSSCML